MNNLKVPLWIIVLIVALPQLSETIYTPSLPELAKGFNVSDSMAEYTLTIYLIGFAFGVLLWGNLSDRIGRKLGLYYGLAIYIIACLGCYFSTSIDMLLCMRFIQAFGASAGSVLGQAIARDVIRAEDRGKVFSKVGIAMAFAPAIGPVLGGVIVQYTHWSNIFLALCFLAGIIVLQIQAFLPETNANIAANRAKRHLYWDCLKQMIQDPKLLGYGFLLGGVNGISFGYFAESPFYFIESLELTSSTFGVLAFIICLPLALGGIISKRMHAQEAIPDKIIINGILSILMGSGIFYVLTYTSMISTGFSLISLSLSMGCIFIIMTGIAMIIPNCISQALESYGAYAGTAASFFGFSYYLIISAMTGIMGLMHNGTQHALPLFCLLIAVLMIIAFKLSYVLSQNRKEA